MDRRDSTGKSADAFSKIFDKLFSPLFFSVIAAAGFGVFSVVQGQDVNWDLLNYHYYNGYAFFNGLTQYHILPAQIQTFLNPTMDVPVYLMIAHWPPMLVGFVLGMIQSLNFTLLFFLAKGMLHAAVDDRFSSMQRNWVALLCAGIGVSAPFFVSEIGTSMGDSLTSILVLGALLLLFGRGPEILPASIPLSGFLAGAAAGLKLTNLIFVLALVLCGWWVRRDIGQAMRRLGLFLGGAGAAFLLFHGYWSWQLFQNYRSPLFPFFNRLFRSPSMNLTNWADPRFLPHSVVDALSYPFQWAVGRHPSAEWAFRDLRFAMLAIALVGCAGVLVFRSFRHHSRSPQPIKTNFLLFFFISFGIWIFSFAIHRYVILLELLSGLCLFLLLETILKSRKILVPLFFVLAVMAIATTRYPDWIRVSWSADWFDVRIPAKLGARRQMVILLGEDPISYVIPSFPQHTRFVRIGSNFIPEPGTPLAKHIERTIKEHQGRMFSLGLRKPDKKQLRLLAGYGLTVTPRTEIVISSKAHPAIFMFRLSRRSQTAGSGSGAVRNVAKKGE